MLNPTTNDLLPPTSSPTISSFSSSDFDSESTGSFFHDRSTTLGTLMGVTFPSITFRAPSQHRLDTISAGNAGGSRRRREVRMEAPETEAEEDEDPDHDGEDRWRRRSWLRKRRRRWWWGLCGDDACRDGGGGGGRRKSSSASLAEFLDLERRFGEALYGGGGGVGMIAATRPGERVLFADGRVLPPVDRGSNDGESTAVGGGGGFRFPASLSGICNRGVG